MSVNVPIHADINTAGFESVKRYLDEIARKAGLSDKEIDDMNQSIDQSGKKAKKAGEEVKAGFGGLNDTMKSFGKGVAAAFSAQLIIGFAKKVIDVTANFQKMEAVLTNTLGSRSAAQVSMRMIQDFASKTPFQVDKLTESYIKLANQGFKPNRDELTKLGDLASSTGKDFDQLVEGIIDAQVGEFERLKEFGIRAQKEGDKVRFTFKGVQKEVDNTEESIRGYILSLGELEGVSGSMAAVSETVGGKISNLDDNFTQLLTVIGNSSSGLMASVLDLANNALGALVTRFDAINQATKDDNGLVAFGKFISSMVNPVYGAALEAQAALLAKAQEHQEGLSEAGRSYFEAEGKERKARIEAHEAELKRQAEIANVAAKKKKEEDAKFAALGIIGKLEHEINDLQKQRAFALGPAELSLIDARIDKRKQEIAAINMLSKAIEAPSIEDPFSKGIEPLVDNFEKLKKRSEQSLDNFVKKYTDSNKKAKQSDADLAKYKEELVFASIDTASFAVDAIAQIISNGSLRQIETLELERDRKLELAGEDADQRVLIEAEFNAKIAAEKRKAAIADRAASLFQVALNTAVGITQTIRNLGFPAAFPFVALAAAQGIAQAALIASQPIPKFAKGVYDLKGPGTDTSDSVHAMLSRGESVVPAGRSRAFKDIIQPIIEDEHMNYEKLLGIVLDKVPASLRGDLFRPVKTQSGDGRMLLELTAIKQAIKNQSGAQILIDQSGVTVRDKRRSRTIQRTNDFLYG